MLFRKYKFNKSELRDIMCGIPIEKRSFWPDLFNRKKVRRLEQELVFYRKKIESLRSDVDALEKIKDGIEAELGINKDASSRIPTKQTSSLDASTKIASEAPVRSVRYAGEQLACVDDSLSLGVGVAIGTVVASEVMDTTSDSCSSLSIGD